MAGDIEFTNNYTDLSTDQGFQFEFICNRCRNGYRTEFDSYELATATNLLDSAGSLLGGFFSQGAAAAEKVKTAAWERAATRPSAKAVGDPPQVHAMSPLQRLGVQAAVLEREEGAVQRLRPGHGCGDGGGAGEQVGGGGVGSRQDERGGQAPLREGLARGHRGLVPGLRGATGDQRQVLPPVRPGPQDRQALHTVRREAAARGTVLRGVWHESRLIIPPIPRDSLHWGDETTRFVATVVVPSRCF